MYIYIYIYIKLYKWHACPGSYTKCWLAGWQLYSGIRVAGLGASGRIWEASDSLAGWLAGWLTGWLAGWLSGEHLGACGSIQHGKSQNSLSWVLFHGKPLQNQVLYAISLKNHQNELPCVLFHVEIGFYLANKMRGVEISYFTYQKVCVFEHFIFLPIKKHVFMTLVPLGAQFLRV